MYKKASKFFQQHSGLLKNKGGKHTAKSPQKKDIVQQKLLKMFPQYCFTRVCRYKFEKVNVFLYKYNRNDSTGIVVIVNKGPLRTVSKNRKKIFWNPSGTDKISIAKFIVGNGYTYKAVIDFLKRQNTSEKVLIQRMQKKNSFVNDRKNIS